MSATGSLFPDAPRADWEPELGEIVATFTATGQCLRKVVVGAGGEDFPCWHVAWEGSPLDEWVPWPIEDVAPIAFHPDALSREEYLRA